MRNLVRRIALVAVCTVVVLAAAAAVVWRLLDTHPVLVSALVETEAVRNDGDAADDPAIWVDTDEPERSLILGTDKNKRGGLAVYDLAGNELQFIAGSRINNVDVRQGFVLDGTPVALAVAGEKTDCQLIFFTIDPEARRLTEIPGSRISTGVKPEGIALYHSPATGRFFVFTVGDCLKTDEEGWLEQWEVTAGTTTPVEGRLARRFRVGGESEGMVADDRTGHLYVSEEVVGIWRYGAEPDAGEERLLVDEVGWTKRLRYNVEGLAIFDGAGDDRYLLASSQGSSDFTVYRIAGEPEYIGRFRITAGNGVDSVTHTDGIDVVAGDFGPAFRRGLFVAQDDGQDGGENQNFKLAAWEDIAAALELK